MGLKKTPTGEVPTLEETEPAPAPQPVAPPPPAAAEQDTAEADNASAARAAGQAQLEQDRKDKESDPPVRKYRSRAFNMRDPITGVLYYADRPTVGEASSWLTSQLRAKIIEEV